MLRRFFNRRGTPEVINSDNGSNFISAEVQKFANSHGTTWKFNVAAAPWQGGFFERLIQSVKRCLKKVVGKALITYEELITVLCEIERILNNRPLTVNSEDIYKEPLTPNHLLYGKYIDIDYSKDDGIINDDSNVRYKYITEVLTHFWNRWLNEYIVNLREKHKRLIQSPSKFISVGDIVLVHEDKVPRGKWKIAKVMKLLISADEKIRSATVEYMLNGTRQTINRTINKLYPLELANERLEINSVEPVENIETIRIRFVDELEIPHVN